MKASSVYFVLYVDCPYCGETHELPQDQLYNQQQHKCKECGEIFIVLD